jgi:hypothetical protein
VWTSNHKLIYFSPTELALALAIIHAMLIFGGWFIRHENRRELFRSPRRRDGYVRTPPEALGVSQFGSGAARDQSGETET